jgi:hypothetical protein
LNRTIPGLLFLIGATALPQAAAAADVAQGQTLAKRWCDKQNCKLQKTH